MTRRKPKDLPLDELIRQFMRCAQRVERATGGYVNFRMEFRPKEPQQEITGPVGSVLTQEVSDGR